MVPFKPIELEDRARVLHYTLSSPRRNCDLSFVNLYSWSFLYQTEIAEQDGFLLFRFYVDGGLAYMMPVGEGDVRPVVAALMEDANRLNAPFRMLGVCVNMKETLEQAFPGRFRFTSDRDYADYIYLRSDLATLRGKKFFEGVLRAYDANTVTVVCDGKDGEEEYKFPLSQIAKINRAVEVG